MTSKDGSKHTISWFNLSKLFQPVPYWANWAVGVDLTPRLKAEFELEQKNKELSEQSQRLTEMNAALNVLLQKQEEDRKNLIVDFVTNHERLVLPFLGKLKRTRLSPQQEALVDIIAENILTSTINLGGPLSHIRSRLTTSEFEVAGLISHGKSTQEIADLLNISPHTAGAHRNSIRRKLNLVNKGVNLAAYLQSAFLRYSSHEINTSAS
jgi:DNA-binding CsgD family transcriptional regulator